MRLERRKSCDTNVLSVQYEVSVWALNSYINEPMCEIEKRNDCLVKVLTVHRRLKQPHA